jgi:hypothetical protein
VQCSLGYEGTPSVIKCKSPGEPYTFSGCKKAPVCKSAMKHTWGYKETTDYMGCGPNGKIQSADECATAVRQFSWNHLRPVLHEVNTRGLPSGCSTTINFNLAQYNSETGGWTCGHTHHCVCRTPDNPYWPRLTGYRFDSAVEHHLGVDRFSVSNTATMYNRG